jgi:hypothetical protein
MSKPFFPSKRSTPLGPMTMVTRLSRSSARITGVLLRERTSRAYKFLTRVFLPEALWRLPPPRTSRSMDFCLIFGSPDSDDRKGGNSQQEPDAAQKASPFGDAE